MAAYFTVVKALLPYLAQIVTAAIPAFTKKTDQAGAEVTRNQISELQEAATHNAESLKMLATQLQQVISDIDIASLKLEKEIKMNKWLSIIAISLSSIAIILWLSARGHFPA